MVNFISNLVQFVSLMLLILLILLSGLSMGMVVIQPYISVSKLKKIKTKFLRCTGYLNFIKSYKARFIASSSYCTTTDLSKLLTTCLTAVKNMLSSTVKRYMRDPVKHKFGLLKIQVKLKINLKLEISMRPVCLLKISTLCTNLPHNLIKDKLIDLIKRTFQTEESLYLACNDRNAFFTLEKPKKYHAWSCQKVCDALTFLLDNFLINLAPSCIDK